MFCPMEVFAIEQRDEFRMIQVIPPGEFEQSHHAIDRRDIKQMQGLLGSANALIGIFEHRAKQFVLVAEVVIKHPLVDTSTLRDAVHSRTTQAARGKLASRSAQDFRPGALRIAGFCRGGLHTEDCFLGASARHEASYPLKDDAQLFSLNWTCLPALLGGSLQDVQGSRFNRTFKSLQSCKFCY